MSRTLTDADAIASAGADVVAECKRLGIELGTADIEHSASTRIDRDGSLAGEHRTWVISASVRIPTRRRNAAVCKHPRGAGSQLRQALACWIAEAESLVGFVRGQEREDGNDGDDAGGMART